MFPFRKIVFIYKPIGKSIWIVEKNIFNKIIGFFVIGRITLRLFLNRSQFCIFEKYALPEGMGSGILIKIAGMQKSPNGVSVIHGESCFEKVEKPFIIKSRLFGVCGKRKKEEDKIL